ncbi:sensor histidine kinase [Streptococcus oralis]|uniref:sensor histidine kinase n=1 Tax=Streptococcus oralis TaxID=1303 RepID=UPI001BAEA23C|nr:sensor histidine kinase [Streptococcus oralis]MBS3687707.1 sensor histidine kinase [Streptococcus oralis]MCY7082965.1 sensor histidine kinase [Streptococcus oralis]
MLDWKLFFLAYLRSRSRLFIYIFSLGFLVFLFQFLFASIGFYFFYFFLLSSFLTLLFLVWDIFAEAQVYRQEILYAERDPKSPLEYVLAEKLEERESELYQKKSEAQSKLTDLLDYYTLWVHQIKTPIAASRLLVAEVSDREVKQQLEQEIFKIDSYTNLVLQYLRLESFHDDLVFEKVQVEDLVKEVVRKYALFFIQKGLTVNLHDLDKIIVTDKKWLLVVIEQILSNSLKYTKKGGLEIYMEGQELCIKDTGIGIKNSDVLRVFERGFSGYNGRLTQQSSGLGLYLSKKISEELGHQIRIESEVGKGTTVRIQFAQVNLVLE